MASCLEPSPRRTRRVLIRDVPLPVRRRAAWEAAMSTEDPLDKLRLRLLAEDPGDLAAYVKP